MLSEQDSVTNVSVGFKAPCWSLHTKLYKFRQNISESPNISVAYQKLHRPYPWRGSFMYRSNRSFNMPPPPGHTPGIWHLWRPGEEGIWLSESSKGWGIWSPCFRGGEFELHPRFHVKSLGNGVLEYFCGKDFAFFGQLVTRRGLKQALCRIWSI